MDRILDDVIHSLYDAALDGRKWPLAVKRLADSAGAQHAALNDSDLSRGIVYRQVLHGITEDDTKLYKMEYAAIDPRIPITLGSSRTGWLSDHDLFDAEFRRKDRFYQEYLSRFGYFESLLSNFAKEGSRIGTMVLLRDASHGKAPRDIRQRLDLAFPHLDRAIRIARRFVTLATDIVLGDSLLGALPEPLACVAADGRITRANRAFKERLQHGDVLSDRGGYLQARRADKNTQLLRAIRECCSIAQRAGSKDPEAPITIRLDRSARLPCFVTVAPIAGQLEWAGPASALIRIDEPDLSPSAKQLMQTFSLTVAEARLVMAIYPRGRRGG